MSEHPDFGDGREESRFLYAKIEARRPYIGTSHLLDSMRYSMIYQPLQRTVYKAPRFQVLRERIALFIAPWLRED